MTNGKTSAAASGQNVSGNLAAESSDERRFLDAIEDDEVKEVLRGFRQSQENPPTKKTSAR